MSTFTAMNVSEPRSGMAMKMVDNILREGRVVVRATDAEHLYTAPKLPFIEINYTQELSGKETIKRSTLWVPFYVMPVVPWPMDELNFFLFIGEGNLVVLVLFLTSEKKVKKTQKN